MKGLVFKEFINLIENSYGDEMVEKMIDEANLSSKGAYTSVGTYDHNEIIKLISRLSLETTVPISSLVKFFGKNLTKIFLRKFPNFFQNQNTFSLLKSVDSIIHVEVKKLYPDAELPRFIYEEINEKHLIMDYISTRPFADLAEGLIFGVIDHYNENVQMESVDLSDGKNTARRFIIKAKVA